MTEITHGRGTDNGRGPEVLDDPAERLPRLPAMGSIQEFLKHHLHERLTVGEIAEAARCRTGSVSFVMRALVGADWDIVAVKRGIYICRGIGRSDPTMANAQPVPPLEPPTPPTPVIERVPVSPTDEPLDVGMVLGIVMVTPGGNLLAEGSDGRLYRLTATPVE